MQRRILTGLGRVLPFLLLGTLGCTADLGASGDSDDPGALGTDGSKPNPSGPDPTTGILPETGEPTGDPTLAGVRGLILLSRAEFNRTVRDLLGDETLLADTFAQDPIGEHGFVQPALVTAERVRGYQAIAETLAAHAVQDLDALDQCDVVSTGEEECARAFISSFGLRAYRAPLDPTEVDHLVGLYREIRELGPGTHLDGVRALISVMLQSPRFLYHHQVDSVPGDGEGIVRLGPYELASRLSYLIWGSMPDPVLFEAAAAGGLETETDIVAQVQRMLRDPKAQDAIADFHDQWLDLARVVSTTKDPTLFPDFSEEVKVALLGETLAFTSHVVTQGDGRLETMMTADYSLMNERVAQFYGEVGVYGESYVVVPQSDPARRGLLTQAAIVAGESNPASTNPARSGFMILNRFLCDSIPPPPPGATAEFQLDDSLSVRQNFERLETGEAGASCQSCHETINPLGYGFESFDPIGQARTHDGVHPVDASGFVESKAGVFAYDDLRGLGAALYQAPEFRGCYARKWIRFGLKRIESEADLFSLEDAYQGFAAADFNIPTYLEALATSRTFRFRTLEEGELL